MSVAYVCAQKDLMCIKMLANNHKDTSLFIITNYLIKSRLKGHIEQIRVQKLLEITNKHFLEKCFLLFQDLTSCIAYSVECSLSYTFRFNTLLIIWAVNKYFSSSILNTLCFHTSSEDKCVNNLFEPMKHKGK